MRNRAPRGYTLIEVLIVVTIMGILGAMVIPALGQTHVLRTQAVVRAVVADITYAQSDALAYQRGRAVIFEPDENRYTLAEVNGQVIDPVADALFDPRRPDDRYVVDLDDDDRFAGARFENIDLNGGNVLIFDEIGGPTPAGDDGSLSTGGSLDIVGGTGRRFRISISAFTGRVRVQEIDD